MDEIEPMPKHKHREEDHPYRMRLPGFLNSDEIGLGDVIKRVSFATGIRPCSGCERRAARLNRLLVFSR